MKTEITESKTNAQSGLALITLDPARYVAEVYAPFCTKLDAAKVAADAIEIDCTTTAGNAIAVKQRAIFRDDVRLAVESARTERKAPILTIGRLIDSVAKEITQEAAPYEERFDKAIKDQAAKVQAEKDAKIAVERARIEAINVRMDNIRSAPVRHIASDSTKLAGAIEFYMVMPVATDDYEEFTDAAKDIVSETIEKLKDMQIKASEAEAEAARVLAEREAAAAKAKQEREELAAAQAELKRQQAAQAEETQRQRDAMAAEMKAEREKSEELRKQKEEANRLAKAESDRIAAEHAQKMAEQQAAMDARQRDLDHVEAIQMNAQFDQLAAARKLEAETVAAELERETATLTVVEAPQAQRTGMDLLCDVIENAQTVRPTDDEIVKVIADHFDVRSEIAYGWLCELSHDIEYF